MDRRFTVRYEELMADAEVKPEALEGVQRRLKEFGYPLLVSEIRKLNRPLGCIIEQINPEQSVMSKTKAWVEEQIRRQ